MIRTIGFAAALLLAGGWHGPAQAQSALSAAMAAICRPVFEVDGKPLEAGTAFILARADNGAQPLLVTAIHLFGPAGGLDADIAWSQMPARASLDRCVSLANGKSWRGGKALSVPEAAAFGDTSYRDIAAFPLNPADVASVTALRLSPTAPKRGDKVWMVAQVIGVPATHRLHAATVVYAGADALQYSFDDTALQLRATSGAPVVNAAGQVVSVNLGGGRDGTELLGLGPSLSVLTDALGKAH